MIKGIFQQSVQITSFILVMMLLIEYLNVITRGSWQNHLKEKNWLQYLFAAAMGAIPGCLGAFTVVSLYSHGIVTIGALVTTMIATSGDEAFVMLAMIPNKFLIIAAILVAVSLVAGWLTDIVFRGHITQKVVDCDGFDFHEQAECICFSPKIIVTQLKNCSSIRGILCIFLGFITLFFVIGVLGPPQWNWIRVTLVIVATFGLFVVITVPEHFLEDHLWKHVVKQHVPKLFLWTFGTLLFFTYLSQHIDMESSVRESQLIVLVIAVLIGIIPESGPHLVFVIMYANGILPMSVLIANSIVQDGHGMIPMLAHSRRGFMLVKAINLVIGLMVGVLGYWSGW